MTSDIYEWSRYDSDCESESEYIFRICSNKDLIGTWSEVAEVINENLNLDYDESCYRKKYQSFKEFEPVSSSGSEGCAELDEKIRELNKARIKLQTEKIELNKALREKSRDEMITEEIQRCVNNIPALPKHNFRTEPQPSAKSESVAGILCFGDQHYGAEFTIKDLYGNIINEYNTEVFNHRMCAIMRDVVQQIDKYHLTTLRILDLGDSLDGVLRVSQLKKLECGVVDATIAFANYMAEWLDDLSKFVEIDYAMTEGNHTELRMLGMPKGTFQDENMSKIIKSVIKARLANNTRVTFTENPTGLIFEKVCGYNLLGIHGEVNNMATALQNFNVMYNTNVDILVGGHKHHFAAETIGMCKDVINIPSIVGTDDFSMSCMKTSNPGATFLTVEAGKGIVDIHNIKL